MASLLTQTPALFPYGTFPVDEPLSTHYTNHYSLAYRYPLSEHLPFHHPLLRSLEGTFPLQPTLPPWWKECVAEVKPEFLRPLLATISVHEFLAGCLEPSQWKAFRSSLSDEQRRQVPMSPKMSLLISGTEWTGHYQNRGPADTPEQLSLVISTRPLDFLYMSNGREWRSCQHLRNGQENQHLPGNFYDTNVAVAMLLPANTPVWQEASVLARTTLRVFGGPKKQMLTIGRTYHNNETLAFLLLSTLADLLDTRQLSWGWMVETNSLFHCERGSLGTVLRQRLISEDAVVESDPCTLPNGWWVPYVDGGERHWEQDWQWEHDEYYRMQLNATIKPMQPRMLAHVPTQTRQALSQLASVEMLPCVL